MSNELVKWVIPEHIEPPELDDEKDEPEFSHSDDLYTSFVRQATRIARLSEEEEREFGLRVRDQHDEAAGKKLVLHNMRLAIKMAHQYRRSWTNLMDLVQEASTGLAIAAQKWDPDMGTRYGTYAAYWIRAQLGKFLMTNGRLIHTANTRAGRKLYSSLPGVRRQLLAQGKEPTIEVIAKEVGESPEEVAMIMARLDAREASLSAPIYGQEGSTLEDTLLSKENDIENDIDRQQIQETIARLIAGFENTIENERDKAIWKEHLIANEPASLVELGQRYHVSKQRMGQLSTRLKRLFRRHVIDQLGPTTQLSWLFND